MPGFVADYPREHWLGGSLAFRDGAWVATQAFAASAVNIEPSESLVGTVGARSGAVIDVRLEELPTG